jgi:hypothetical protein
MDWLIVLAGIVAVVVVVWRGVSAKHSQHPGDS